MAKIFKCYDSNGAVIPAEPESLFCSKCLAIVKEKSGIPIPPIGEICDQPPEDQIASCVKMRQSWIESMFRKYIADAGTGKGIIKVEMIGEK